MPRLLVDSRVVQKRCNLFVKAVENLSSQVSSPQGHSGTDIGSKKILSVQEWGLSCLKVDLDSATCRTINTHLESSYH